MQTSAQYCCLVSLSMCANPPRTRAFIRVRWMGLDKRCRGGLRLANCLAKFHQFSHCTTMFALRDRKGWMKAWWGTYLCVCTIRQHKWLECTEHQDYLQGEDQDYPQGDHLTQMTCYCNTGELQVYKTLYEQWSFIPDKRFCLYKQKLQPHQLKVPVVQPVKPNTHNINTKYINYSLYCITYCFYLLSIL